MIFFRDFAKSCYSMLGLKNAKNVVKKIIISVGSVQKIPQVILVKGNTNLMD